MEHLELKNYQNTVLYGRMHKASLFFVLINMLDLFIYFLCLTTSYRTVAYNA